MLDSLKAFFTNPLGLLATVVSVATIGVGTAAVLNSDPADAAPVETSQVAMLDTEEAASAQELSALPSAETETESAALSETEADVVLPEEETEDEDVQTDDAVQPAAKAAAGSSGMRKAAARRAPSASAEAGITTWYDPVTVNHFYYISDEGDVGGTVNVDIYYYKQTSDYTETWQINDLSYNYGWPQQLPQFTYSTAAWPRDIVSDTSLALTTDISVDEASPYDQTVWVYKRIYWSREGDGSKWSYYSWLDEWSYNGKYYLACIGSTTLGALIDGEREIYQNDSAAEGMYKSSRVHPYRKEYFTSATMDLAAMDETYKDVYDEADFLEYEDDLYYYYVSEEKPSTLDTSDASGWRGSPPEGYKKPLLVNLWYDYAPTATYTASMFAEKELYDSITLKQSTLSPQYYFTNNVTLPGCKDLVPYEVDTMFTIKDEDGETLVGKAETGRTGFKSFMAKEPDGWNAIIFQYHSYSTTEETCFFVEDNWESKTVYSRGSSTEAIGLPVNIMIKYDYTTYRDEDGYWEDDTGKYNIDPLDLNGTYIEEEYPPDDTPAKYYTSYFNNGIPFDTFFEYRQFSLPLQWDGPYYYPEGYVEESEENKRLAPEYWREKEYNTKLSFGSNDISELLKALGYKFSSSSWKYEWTTGTWKDYFTFDNDTGFYTHEFSVEPVYYYKEINYIDQYKLYEYAGYDYETWSEIYEWVGHEETKTEYIALTSEEEMPTVSVKDITALDWEEGGDSGFTNRHRGYTFVGWNTEKDGSGTSYQPGELLKLTAKVTDLYAQWELGTYHLIYDYNSPTGNNSDVIMTSYDEEVYDFVEVSDFATEYTFTREDTYETNPAGAGIVSALGNDVGYYPDWIDNGEDGYLWELTPKFSDPTVTESNVFVYWSLTNGTGAQKAMLKWSDFVKGEDGDYYATVYAIWRGPCYILRYNRNNDTWVNDMPYEDWDNCTYVSPAELKAGYVLDTEHTPYWEDWATGTTTYAYGWSMDPNASYPTAILYLADVEEQNGGPLSKDGEYIEVYALWDEPAKVTVTYQPGYSGPSDVEYSVYVGARHQIISNPFSRAGYDFTGWTLVSPLDQGYPAAPAVGTTISEVNDDLTYVAAWEAQTYTVTYQDGLNNSTEVMASFDVLYDHSHTVQAYDSAAFTEYLSDADVVAAHTGYHLDHWVLVSPSSGYSTTPDDTIAVRSDVVYKGVWEKNTHAVSYLFLDPETKEETSMPAAIVAGGYKRPDTQRGVGYGEEVTVAASYSLSGTLMYQYTFYGWYWESDKNAENPTGISGTTFTMPDEDVVIVGWFVENPKITITYNGNGGTVNGGDTWSEQIYSGSYYTVKSNTEAFPVVRTGYNFKEWNTKADGTGTRVTPGMSSWRYEDITLYAVWEKQTFKITYNYDDSEDTTSRAYTESYGNTHTVRAYDIFPSRLGYTLTGWTLTAPEGGSYPTEPGQTFTVTENVTYTAVWTENAAVTLTYHGNGGLADGSATVTESYAEGATVTVKGQGNFVRDGYKFLGWSKNEAADTVHYTGIGTGTFTITADTDLYAVWEQKLTYSLIYKYKSRMLNDDLADDRSTDMTYVAKILAARSDMDDEEIFLNTLKENAPYIVDLYKTCKWDVRNAINSDTDTYTIFAHHEATEYMVYWNRENTLIDISGIPEELGHGPEDGGTIKSADGETEINCNMVKEVYNKRCPLTAAEFDSEGRSFVYWQATDVKDGELVEGTAKPVCYTLDYNYRITKDIYVEPIYEGERKGDWYLTLGETIYGREQFTNDDGSEKSDFVYADYLVSILTTEPQQTVEMIREGRLQFGIVLDRDTTYTYSGEGAVQYPDQGMRADDKTKTILDLLSEKQGSIAPGKSYVNTSCRENHEYTIYDRTASSELLTNKDRIDVYLKMKIEDKGAFTYNVYAYLIVDGTVYVSEDISHLSIYECGQRTCTDDNFLTEDGTTPRSPAPARVVDDPAQAPAAETAEPVATGETPTAEPAADNTAAPAETTADDEGETPEAPTDADAEEPNAPDEADDPSVADALDATDDPDVTDISDETGGSDEADAPAPEETGTASEPEAVPSADASDSDAESEAGDDTADTGDIQPEDN